MEERRGRARGKEAQRGRERLRREVKTVNCLGGEIAWQRGAARERATQTGGQDSELFGRSRHELFQRHLSLN